MRSAGIALIALTCGSCFLKKPTYSYPIGNTTVVVTNHSPEAICTVDFILQGNKYSLDWDPLKLENPPRGEMSGDSTPPAGTPRQLARAQSITVGLKPGTYEIDATSCDSPRFGRTTADVRGPVALSIGTPDPHPPAGHLAVAIPLAMPPVGTGTGNEQAGPPRQCTPGGDTTEAIASNCCSGRIVMSGKHPGPSHCAYDDE